MLSVRPSRRSASPSPSLLNRPPPLSVKEKSLVEALILGLPLALENGRVVTDVLGAPYPPLAAPPVSVGGEQSNGADVLQPLPPGLEVVPDGPAPYAERELLARRYPQFPPAPEDERTEVERCDD